MGAQWVPAGLMPLQTWGLGRDAVCVCVCVCTCARVRVHVCVVCACVCTLPHRRADCGGGRGCAQPSHQERGVISRCGCVDQVVGLDMRMSITWLGHGQTRER